MKILTINCYYEKYSTGKIIKDIESELISKGCQFVHCYECGEKSTEKNAYRLSGYWEYRVYYVLSHLSGAQYAGGILSNVRLKRILKKENPDIVHIHCPNAFSLNLYKLLDYLKKNKISTVITNHAEFFFTGNCAHADACNGYISGCKVCPDYKSATHSIIFNRTKSSWKKMKKSFENFEKIYMVAVSPWAQKRIEHSTICYGLPCCTIYNGIDTSVFCAQKTDTIYAKYNINRDEPLFLHATSSFSDQENDLKGGIYILKLARKLQDMGIRCRFLIVGPLFLEREYDDLKNVIFAEKINDQKMLAQIYSSADLTIMTSRRETFGLTCVESMCCGTPVVGFENGGSESIALPEYSCFVTYGDLDELMVKVLEWSKKKRGMFGKLCEEAAKVYGKEAMADNYYQIYQRLFFDQKQKDIAVDL